MIKYSPPPALEKMLRKSLNQKLSPMANKALKILSIKLPPSLMPAAEPVESFEE